MLLLALAAILPGLFWEQGTGTAPSLEKAGIKRIYVPAALADAWRAAGFDAVPVDDATRSRYQSAQPPGVQWQVNTASATRTPWIDANGWQFIRKPRAAWWYELPAGAAALAAAEAFAYGVDAVLRIDPADLEPLGRMLTFLRSVDGPALPALTNITVVDDNSPELDEVLNMLARRNLLFRVASAPDPSSDLNLRPGPDAADPVLFAVKARQQLTDERRLVRIYGSDTVLVRLAGDGTRARVHLLNYAQRPVEGLRVRVRGIYKTGVLHVPETEGAALADYAASDGATEFTVPRLEVYAVIDLNR
ncbi:MAG TPA: hypothetical protein PLA43_07890 [Bryobacteraceae bacterium]|nr:hypothetical protein [Bryobacteraceae bacterium]HOQ44652.1 hypothetical protein [Bryobacteraceae bacterium]HPU71862.1 hypothetical protein [Bryobacteraceae bacterium]